MWHFIFSIDSVKIMISSKHLFYRGILSEPLSTHILIFMLYDRYLKSSQLFKLFYSVLCAMAI